MVIIRQDEVYNFFRKEYLTGNKEFMSCRDVYKKLGCTVEYSHICKLISKLFLWDYLDIEVREVWKRKYRIKEKYVYLEGVIPQSIFGRKEKE